MKALELLIYAIIAGVLVYRLYTLFGQRDGGAPRQPPRPFFFRNGEDSQNDRTGKSPQTYKDGPRDKDDLLALPLGLPKAQGGKDGPAQNLQAQMDNPFQVAPAEQSLAGGLFAIQKADPSFDERSFLKGARAAFEMIVRAYTGGDRVTLKALLVPKLYAAFEAAISEREMKGERWETKLFNLKDIDVISAKLEGTIATLAVQCVSEQSKMVYDKNGALIHDPGREVESLRDIWVFRRDVKSANPNWQLVETRAA